MATYSRGLAPLVVVALCGQRVSDRGPPSLRNHRARVNKTQGHAGARGVLTTGGKSKMDGAPRKAGR